MHLCYLHCVQWKDVIHWHLPGNKVHIYSSAWQTSSWCVLLLSMAFPPIPYKGCSRGPKLSTYSDWGLSSVLVINKHLSHHGRSILKIIVISIQSKENVKNWSAIDTQDVFKFIRDFRWLVSLFQFRVESARIRVPKQKFIVHLVNLSENESLISKNYQQLFMVLSTWALLTLGIEGVFLYSLYNFIQTLEEDLTLKLNPRVPFSSSRTNNHTLGWLKFN